jgi:hypothetical protein
LGPFFNLRFGVILCTVPSAESNRQNGRKSNGPKTLAGRRVCALAAVGYGVHSWSPCLPGEIEQDWTDLLAGCRQYFRPVGVPEDQIVFAIAMTYLQMHRLYRREKEVSLAGARVDVFSPMEKERVQEQIEAILDGRGAELRLEITVLDNLITTLETLPTTPVEMRLGG